VLCTDLSLLARLELVVAVMTASTNYMILCFFNVTFIIFYLFTKIIIVFKYALVLVIQLITSAVVPQDGLISSWNVFDEKHNDELIF